MKVIPDPVKKNLLQAIDVVEDKFSNVKFALKKKLNLLEPVFIHTFLGFGNGKYIYFKGRVMEKKPIQKPQEVDNVWENLHNIAMRYETDEIPGVRVKATFQGQEQIEETDDEGFFQFEFNLDQPLPKDKEEVEVALELLDEITDKDDLKTNAKILLPSEEAEFGIVSDMDDTVLVSKVTELLGRLKLMVKNTAAEREPFPGIAAFLRALQKGPDDKGKNPLFFVSGSEWNLYGLLTNFLEIHDIPLGPLLLRDKGTEFDKGKYETGSSHYKVDKIKHIFDTYPDMKFIMIGDSGQHDAETYLELAEQYKGKILAVYIRDVSSDKRDKEIKDIEKKLSDLGVKMAYSENTEGVAKHAVKNKWIREIYLDEIKEEKEEQKNK